MESARVQEAMAR